jgi:hypothetical protein
MSLHRIALTTLALPMTFAASLAQQVGGFVGQWQGTVDAIGDAKIVITGVRPDGRIEGRMEFALQSCVASFADNPHPVQKLAGSYTRGTTFNGRADFRRM